MQNSWNFLGGAVLVLSTAAVHAQINTDPAWVDLADDQSRSQLGTYEMLNYAPPGEKAVRQAFSFPDDADDGIYGVDVSHHNGLVDWSKLAASKVRFAYIKASQGSKFRDSRFDANWRAAGAAGIARGAYHFLSAEVDGVDQAKSYLALLEKSGGLTENDLTPVLDIEWDMEKVGNERVDRWSSKSASQIAAIAKAWLEAVQARTGRHPMIYTAASWWNERMAGSDLLKAYPHWIADYRSSSINAGAPKTVRQHPNLAWQFTDAGGVDGTGGKFDVNRLKSNELNSLKGR